MAFCLPKSLTATFIKSLKDGTINPAKLVDMTSAERRTFFDDLLGKENGKEVNALLESKLLLKNQIQGMQTWAKQIAGLKPEIRRDLISRIEKMDRVLDPASEKEFLSDLAEKRLGVGVSFEEAQKITELSQAIKANESKKGDADYDTRMEYGRAAVELNNYVNDLKLDAQKTPIGQAIKTPAQTLAKGVVNAPGFFKSIQAAFDNSALFRQGWKTLFANPIIWQRNARKTFRDIYNTLGGKKVASELEADLVSRPNADLYKQAKLDIGTMEEAFPTSLPAKVPGLGRLYKASENAYTGFLHKTRADVFDKYVEIAKDSGVELNKQELQNIGRLVNSLTGRGYLGALGGKGADVTNVLFFSPRNIKAHIDTLTQPFTGGASLSEIAKGENTGSNFVRKEAAKNLTKAVIGTATVLMIAKFINPDSVDFDPRSADFGKIKAGKTRFDVTGGMGSLIPLVARMMTGQSKSSTSGKITNLTEGKFGQSTRWDVMLDFLGNKLSPVARVGKDFMVGKDFDGNKVSPSDPRAWAKEGLSLITPLPVKTAIEMSKDPNTSNAFKAFAVAMDMLGVGVNNYGQRADGSLGDKVRSGAMSKEDAKKEIETQYKAGKITNAAAKKQLADIERDAFADTVENLKAGSESDFQAIEKAIKEADTPEKKKALWKKLTNLRKNKDSSPKGKDERDQLDLLINKLESFANKDNTPRKFSAEGMPYSEEGRMDAILQHGLERFKGQRESENVEDHRTIDRASMWQDIEDGLDAQSMDEIIDNTDGGDEERIQLIKIARQRLKEFPPKERLKLMKVIQKHEARIKAASSLKNQGIVVAN